MGFMGGYTDLGARVWSPEGVQALGVGSIVQDVGGFNWEGTENELAQAWGEGRAGPGVRGAGCTERAVCGRWGVCTEAEGVWAPLRGRAGPRDGKRGGADLEGAPGPGSGLVCSSPSHPPLPLHSAPTGLLWAESRRLQTFVSASGPWGQGEGLPREKGRLGKPRCGHPG